MSNDLYILVGLKGAGKTSLAQYLQSSLGYTMYDVDDVLLQQSQQEKEHGAKSIRELYSELGKKRFRALEYHALHKLLANMTTNVACTKVVIATGGGIVDNNRSYRLLRRCSASQYRLLQNYRCTVFFLEVDPYTQLNNLRVSGNIPSYLANHSNPQKAWLKLARRRIQKYNNIATEKVDAATIFGNPSQIKQLFSHSAV